MTKTCIWSWNKNQGVVLPSHGGAYIQISVSKHLLHGLRSFVQTSSLYPMRTNLTLFSSHFLWIYKIAVWLYPKLSLKICLKGSRKRSIWNSCIWSFSWDMGFQLPSLPLVCSRVKRPPMALIKVFLTSMQARLLTDSSSTELSAEGKLRFMDLFWCKTLITCYSASAML